MFLDDTLRILKVDLGNHGLTPHLSGPGSVLLSKGKLFAFIFSVMNSFCAAFLQGSMRSTIK
jgi:hypothetical protein